MPDRVPDRPVPDAPEGWAEQEPPEAAALWRWRPTALTDLPAIRREVRARIVAHEGPAAGAVADPDTVVLALDELMSNALRHGRAPVVVDVGRTADAWLLTVCDQAAEDPPRPAVQRDPAQGGTGLRIVAHHALREGWFTSGAGKHVWVLLP